MAPVPVEAEEGARQPEEGPPDPMLGRELLGYRVIREIGRGGMGAVYEALHESIGQRAAVKVLFPEYSGSPEYVNRFIAEARAASVVQHSGLVKIFNYGLLPDGTAYIMMEFLAGESLRARLERVEAAGQHLQLDEALRITRQMGSALAAVHRRGIVHRDLKPANVIIVPDPQAAAGEMAKVVDFGIAKFNDEAAPDAANSDSGGGASAGPMTTVGRFLGTAIYASPEQCQMAGHVDAKADVYSMGVMLYEMLAGAPPFVAGQPGVVIGMHIFKEPRPLHELAPTVPESMCQLVHQMLAKDPKVRPGMDQVMAAVEHLKPDGRLLWLQRRARPIAAVAAALLVLGGGGTLYRLRAARAPGGAVAGASAGGVPAASLVQRPAVPPSPSPAPSPAAATAPPLATPAPAAGPAPERVAETGSAPPARSSGSRAHSRRKTDHLAQKAAPGAPAAADAAGPGDKAVSEASVADKPRPKAEAPPPPSPVAEAPAAKDPKAEPPQGGKPYKYKHMAIMR